MTEPSEIWAAVLLLTTSAIVSSVAGQARRHALEARRAADEAHALQAAARVIIEDRSQSEIIKVAAAALGRIFAAPAIVFAETEGRLWAEATAGDATVSGEDTREAGNAWEARCIAGVRPAQRRLEVSAKLARIERNRPTAGDGKALLRADPNSYV